MSRFIACRTGAVRWQVHADLWGGMEGSHSCPLFGPDGLRLDDWLAQGQARVVKQGLHRTVYHVVLPGLDFHLKHYPLTDTRSWLRQLIRPSKARMEYRRTLAVAGRGVPTLEPLAFGEFGSTIQASYLITRTLPNVYPLDLFMEQTLPKRRGQRQAEMRQRLAQEMGCFVARMHQAGVTHQDLHPGNLLLRLDHEDTPRLYLIDLHAVRLGGELHWNASRDNLVLFNRWFIMRAERSDRFRFFQHYAQARKQLADEEGATRSWLNWLPGAKGALIGRPQDAERDLERRTVASNLAFWHHHDPRCLANNRYFRRLRSAQVRGHAVTDLDADWVADLLADPDEPFRRPGAVVHKNSRTSSVVEIEIPGPHGPRQLIYKRFNLTHWTDPWAAFFRCSPALRSYRMGHALRWRGLPTPRPLLLLHRQHGPLPREGYLLTEKLPNARHLLDFVNELTAQPAAQVRRILRAMIQQLARLISDLHERRMLHRDLKAANLLVSSEPWRVAHPDRPDSSSSIPLCPTDASLPQLWLIDLVGVSRMATCKASLCLKNLTRIHASFHAHPALMRTDKLRFLREYLRWGLRGKVGWKKWWREIDRATQEKIRRNLRRGRPLL
jgi:tRNA A-37 threonylcarbamoyl transferase component Bud32